LVEQAVLAPQQSVVHSSTPEDELGADSLEPKHELGLLTINNFDPMSLGAAVMACQLAADRSEEVDVN